MKYNPLYQLKHLSIRVPWHDSGWNGTICKNPKANGACLILKNCALSRDDDKEQDLAGKQLKDLAEEDYPVCIGERATFMASFPFNKTLTHPYIESSPTTHGHLRPTHVQFPSFSAPAVPYHWMLKENAKEKTSRYDLNFDDQREPVLDWGNGTDNWVQEYLNQKALLNCFFEHLSTENSLVFFYVKQVPFVEESGRVLVGVGRIQKIIPSEKYDGSNNRFGAAYWEHMILHSIRNDKKNGFLLPYHEALIYQQEHPGFNPEELAVIVPNDKRFEFSYAAEHVGNDTAIRVLLECLLSLEKADKLGIGVKNGNAIKWIHDEISRIEKLRGIYPGMGSALFAFGIEKGHFIAAEIANQLNENNQNPWLLFEKALENPNGILSTSVAGLIPNISKKLYERLKQKEKPIRLKFLHILSRFDLSIEQATMLFVEEERVKTNIHRSETEYINNPYLIFEDLRLSLSPVSLSTIDLGLYLKNPPSIVFPDNLVLTDPFEIHRIRALTIQQLEIGIFRGHTLLPRKEIIRQIREMSIEPGCPITGDYFEVAEECFPGFIDLEEMKNGERAYQITRFSKTRIIIHDKIKARVGGNRLSGNVNWEDLINKALAPITLGDPDDQEIKARMEKATALKEITESRFSVLIGPAGTGKTTLLTVLAGQKAIEAAGVLLLAPTGKARVRMEEIARNIKVTAKTLAQFLTGYDRYNGELQQYLLEGQYCDGLYETVIFDEASMLTEEMLATTLDCLKGVKRIILVGDHRQLPPIGAGRPFVDIINFLKPEGIESSFPRVDTGYAELTIKRRQGGSKREDLQLAEWFSGESLEPGADSVFTQIISNRNSSFLRMESWENEEDFEKLFEDVLISELGLDSINDIKNFNKSLGSEDGIYFNFRTAVHKTEAWQILSPIREKPFGVKAINRKIHKLFKADTLRFAYTKYTIPRPIGLEEIVYGDKVINLYNSRRKPEHVYPSESSLKYIANGEIGIVVGQMKTQKSTFKGRPTNTEIEFISQKGFKYTFKPWEFNDEGESPLELAYALTVHKAQGSEFDKVFLVVPNPCFLLTREMLYTALTRQKEKIIMLYQGNTFDIKALSSPLKSDTLKRITNLFEKPELVEIEGHFLEKNLIHQASDGKLLRSKSELLIYQRLIDKNTRPIYEKRLVIKEVEKLPDFTIENEETGKTYYWEHCGMLHDTEYKQRWEEKYKWYRENGIIPLEEGGGKNGTLIITEDKPVKTQDGSIRGAISVIEIDKIIDKIKL